MALRRDLIGERIIEENHTALWRNIKILDEGDPLVSHLLSLKILKDDVTDEIYSYKGNVAKWRCLTDYLIAGLTEEMFSKFVQAIGDPRICNCVGLQGELLEKYNALGGRIVLSTDQIEVEAERPVRWRTRMDSKVTCISENNACIVFITESGRVSSYYKRENKCERMQASVDMQSCRRIIRAHWIDKNDFVLLPESVEATHRYDLRSADNRGGKLMPEEFRVYLKSDLENVSPWLSSYISSMGLLILASYEGYLLSFRISNDPQLDSELQSESTSPLSSLKGIDVSRPVGDEQVYCVLWNESDFVIGKVLCGIFPRQKHTVDGIILQCSFLQSDRLAVCYFSNSENSSVIDLWRLSIPSEGPLRACHLRNIRSGTPLDLLYNQSFNVLHVATSDCYIRLHYKHENCTFAEETCKDLSRKDIRVSNYKLIPTNNDGNAFLVYCYDNFEVEVLTV